MKIIRLLVDTNKWVKLFSGLLVCVAAGMLIHSVHFEESIIGKKLIILLAIPGAFALMGFLEIVAGVPFREIAGKWDSLAGWQRGVLGTVIVMLAFIVIFSGIVLFVL